MKYGLPPYDEESTIKNIIATTELPKHRIKLILDTFALELTTPQSVFHKNTDKINEDLHSIGIGWVINVLGDYKDVEKAPTQQTKPSQRPLRPPRREQGLSDTTITSTSTNAPSTEISTYPQKQSQSQSLSVTSVTVSRSGKRLKNNLTQ